MTNKELVKFAAKACGYRWVVIAEREAAGDVSLWLVNEDGSTKHTAWNPLIDDTAAMELLVELKLNLQHLSHLVPGARTVQVGLGNSWFEPVATGLTPAAATRRAIVGAAAYMGHVLTFYREGGAERAAGDIASPSDNLDSTSTP